MSSDKVFNDVKKSFDQITDEKEKQRMKELVEELHHDHKSNMPDKEEKYHEFMALAANHIGLLSPFIPRLKELFFIVK